MKAKCVFYCNLIFITLHLVYRSVIRRVFGALIWVAVTAVVVGLTLGILYGNRICGFTVVCYLQLWLLLLIDCFINFRYKSVTALKLVISTKNTVKILTLNASYQVLTRFYMNFKLESN